VLRVRSRSPRIQHTCRAHAVIGPAAFIAISHLSKQSPTPSTRISICQAFEFTTCRPGPRGCNDRLTTATAAMNAQF
jgi:hypothetical protein